MYFNKTLPILFFLVYHIGDSGRKIVAKIKKRQQGIASMMIKVLNGTTAAQTRDTATNKALFNMFIIDNIPRNRINEISLK